MKKVKILLTAITVFAVVGGALAFKAAKLQSTIYCTSTQNGTCQPVLGTIVEPLQNPHFLTDQNFCTDKIDTPCDTQVSSWEDN